MTLDQAKLRVQREANRDGVTLCVVNLNPVGALYVVREYIHSVERDKAVIWVAYPGTVDQGG